jgi:CRISPR/Cas system-associated exonuclease Cas4 (RecB family)
VTTPRDSPYIWVKWITGILAGDRHCEWSAWFRAHNTGYEVPPPSADLVVWSAKHGEMVRSRADALRRDGYAVYVESQNKFRFQGKAAMLSGVPDLVAVRGAEALVVDCKTGQQRNGDYFQVLVYMLVLPFSHAACRAKALAGEVQYSTTSLSIEPGRLDDEMKAMIRALIERVAAGDAPPRVPSFEECRFCDIRSDDCAERIDRLEATATVDHDLF